MKIVHTLFSGLLALFYQGCAGLPDNVVPVANFELEKYLGTWYEIARLDHSFESGLEQVTAAYSKRSDGGVKVVNRGYNAKKGQWSEAEGRGFFVSSPGQGYLKVSFFGPFYASYVIFELGKNYEYAFVTSSNSSYLWLLARSPRVEPSLLDRFRRQTAEMGFDSERLILVPHN